MASPELAVELCYALLPSARDVDFVSCMQSTVPYCDEWGLGGEALCSSFCVATVALCVGSDKCTDMSTWCPKILCSVSAFCPGEAWDWCDRGSGLSGVDLATNSDGSGSLGSIGCKKSKSTRKLTLWKDLALNDRIWWKCSGTDTYYEANEFSVHSDVPLETDVESKCYPWPLCGDTCRLHWSWGLPISSLEGLQGHALHR